VSVPEAKLQESGSGLAPTSEGWFVLNVAEAYWLTSEGGEKQSSGAECAFETPLAEFAQIGIRIHVLQPGESNGLYHGENQQEDFLVLSGECVLLVEGEERALRAWDFVHCPPWTEHIFVGAGDGPCLVIGVGARRKGRGIRYPVNELALRYGAGVETETTDPREAYARFGENKPVVCPPEFPR
jgi:uncharacterized cupin superfamily protein